MSEEGAADAWSAMGRESLAAAKRLMDAGHVRSCLSRAYYSAYATVTGAMMSQGMTVSIGERPNPSHEQLPMLLRHNLDRRRFDDRTRRDLSQRLRTLRRFRIVADYGPQEFLDRTHALACLRDASIIADRLGEGE